MCPVKFRVATAAAFITGFVIGRREAPFRRHRAGADSQGAPATSPGPVPVVPGASWAKCRAAGILVREWSRDLVSIGIGWRNRGDMADAVIIDLTEELAHVLHDRFRDAS